MSKRGVNSVTVIGTMGQDPKVQQFGNNSFTVVSLATSEVWNDKQSGQKTEETEWHRVVLKGRHGEHVAQYGRKGRELYVLGKLKTRKYTVQGVEKTITEIIVGPYDGQCHFMDSIADQPPGQSSSPSQNAQPRPQSYAPRHSSPRPQQAPRDVEDHDDLIPPPQMLEIPEFDESYLKNIPV